MSECIWAPWRLPYVVSDKQPSGCFLCSGAGSGDDARHHVVHRTEQTLTVLNLYPYTNGHLLVAPLAHKASLAELNDDEMLQCTQVIRRMIEVLGQTLHPHGYNIGLNLGKVAGAGLPGHLHWHVVPRWDGDTNFMPALAAVRVIPQSLEALYGQLTAVLNQPDEKGVANPTADGHRQDESL